MTMTKNQDNSVPHETSARTSEEEKQNLTVNEPAEKEETPRSSWKELLEKGEEMVRTGAEKVSDFTVQTARGAKLKIEIHTLKSDLNKQFQEVGYQLWNLQKNQGLDRIEETLAGRFKKLSEIEHRIEQKENELAA